VAIFGQMFLNGGRYGEVRVLGPATVIEMTRDQTAGIGTDWFGEIFPAASWSFGWSVHGDKKAVGYGSLYSPTAFEHAGANSTYLWIDPAYDLVGVYLSIRGTSYSSIDLFTNVATAAVVEV
jgi:CubicO group peptidase (beta-lactamase class C family)